MRRLVMAALLQYSSGYAATFMGPGRQLSRSPLLQPTPCIGHRLHRASMLVVDESKVEIEPQALAEEEPPVSAALDGVGVVVPMKSEPSDDEPFSSQCVGILNLNFGGYWLGGGTTVRPRHIARSLALSL